MSYGLFLKPVLVTVLASFIMSSFCYGDDENHCVVSTKDSTSELSLINLEGTQSYSLFFFIEETFKNRLRIRPVQTTEERANFNEIIETVAKENDWIPNWYFNTHLKSVAKEFSKGTLSTIVTVRDGIRLTLRNGLNDPLGYLPTTWERAQPLNAIVPFVKQDATWGKTNLTLLCSRKPKDPLGL